MFMWLFLLRSDEMNVFEVRSLTKQVIDVLGEFLWLDDSSAVFVAERTTNN